MNFKEKWKEIENQHSIQQHLIPPKLITKTVGNEKNKVLQNIRQNKNPQKLREGKKKNSNQHKIKIYAKDYFMELIKENASTNQSLEEIDDKENNTKSLQFSDINIKNLPTLSTKSKNRKNTAFNIELLKSTSDDAFRKELESVNNKQADNAFRRMSVFTPKLLYSHKLRKEEALIRKLKLAKLSVTPCNETVASKVIEAGAILNLPSIVAKPQSSFIHRESNIKREELPKIISKINNFKFDDTNSDIENEETFKNLNLKNKQELEKKLKQQNDLNSIDELDLKLNINLLSNSAKSLNVKLVNIIKKEDLKEERKKICFLKKNYQIQEKIFKEVSERCQFSESRLGGRMQHFLDATKGFKIYKSMFIDLLCTV
ncbi:hypothetical protein HDU92_002409 [Lobulomyces angularis]|nr:hypothetical protein HDU92_002409 [Lobulomyces angularis]